MEPGYQPPNRAPLMTVEKRRCPVCDLNFYDNDRSHLCVQTGYCIHCRTAFLCNNWDTCKCADNGEQPYMCQYGCTAITYHTDIDKERLLHEETCLLDAAYGGGIEMGCEKTAGCQETFCSEYEKRLHETQCRQVMFVCELCKVPHTTERQARRCERAHQDTPFEHPCLDPQCTFVAGKPWQAGRHYKNEHGRITYECGDCAPNQHRFRTRQQCDMVEHALDNSHVSPPNQTDHGDWPPHEF